MLDERIQTAFRKANGFDLTAHLVMACQVGSQSHGTYEPSSDNLDDTDYMLVVLPPTHRLLGLARWDHWVFQQDELAVVAYSLDKYIRLLLKSNPNVFGTLYLRDDDYIFRSLPFKHLQDNRHRLESLRAYPAFAGYAYSQLKRLQNGAYQGYMGAERKALVERFGYDPKNAAHLIRLYRMGIEFVGTGKLQVYRPDREELKAIKRGEWSLERVQQEAARLEQAMFAAKTTSPLPEAPQSFWVEQFLVNTQTEQVVRDYDHWGVFSFTGV